MNASSLHSVAGSTALELNGVGSDHENEVNNNGEDQETDNETDDVS